MKKLVFLFLMLMAVPASANVMSPVLVDTYVDSENPDTNYSTHHSIHISKSGENQQIGLGCIANILV